MKALGSWWTNEPCSAPQYAIVANISYVQPSPFIYLATPSCCFCSSHFVYPFSSNRMLQLSGMSKLDSELGLPHLQWAGAMAAVGTMQRQVLYLQESSSTLHQPLHSTVPGCNGQFRPLTRGRREIDVQAGHFPPRALPYLLNGRISWLV